MKDKANTFFSLSCILAVAIALYPSNSTAQQPAPKEAAPVAQPAPLQPLILSGEQLQRLVLAESQLQAAQQAANAAKARYDDLTKQLFLEKGGTLADYELQVQQIGERAYGFVPKAKK